VLRRSAEPAADCELPRQCVAILDALSAPGRVYPGDGNARRTAARTGHPDRPKGQRQSYLICIPLIAREITSCWSPAVPSKMS
jgi:hypothetical protein